MNCSTHRLTIQVVCHLIEQVGNSELAIVLVFSAIRVLLEASYYEPDMQSNGISNGGKGIVSPTFTSSYLPSSKVPTNKIEYPLDNNQQWSNTSLSSSDSSGSWTQEGGLPPPPQECHIVELNIRPASIPEQPAAPGWDNDNSDDDSTEEGGFISI